MVMAPDAPLVAFAPPVSGAPSLPRGQKRILDDVANDASEPDAPSGPDTKAKKARKERSDKGTKRGPRKKRQENVQPPS